MEGTAPRAAGWDVGAIAVEAVAYAVVVEGPVKAGMIRRGRVEAAVADDLGVDGLRRSGSVKTGGGRRKWWATTWLSGLLSEIDFQLPDRVIRVTSPKILPK